MREHREFPAEEGSGYLTVRREKVRVIPNTRRVRLKGVWVW